jgi:hypothetical protein
MSVPTIPHHSRRASRSRRWRLAALPVLMTLPLGLAACGGSSDAATSSRPAGSGQGQDGQGQGQGVPGAADTAAMDSYASCLEDNGVTLPDRPQGGPNGNGQPPQGGGFPGLDSSDPTVAKALQACSSLQPRMPAMPNGNAGSNSAGDGSAASSTTTTVAGA